MKTSFDVSTCTWAIDWPGRVSRHDLVYLTPPTDPLQGFPFGNGEIGALCWCEESRLIIVINRSDLWDDAEFERFHNWDSNEEDRSTTLRHGGRIIIDFGFPIFDIFYLSDFDGRLSISDAVARFSLASPFGKAAFEAFIDETTGVLCCKVETDFSEDQPIEIKVERYGSRTFSHWYRKITTDPTIGLNGTEAIVDSTTATVSHRLTSGQFSIGCRVHDHNGLDVEYCRRSNHRADIQISGESKKSFRLLTAITSPLAGDSNIKASACLDRVQQIGVESLFISHAEKWKAFWLRSLMDSGDSYLDNLWHLTMYYANASQRGAYPANFISGLWAWNRDVKNWNFYFHWNQQQIYWPLNAAGHSNLCESYLNYRFNSLPHGKRDAQEVFGSDGAIVSDVSERRGYNSIHEFKNHTPVAQIAMDFWRQYQYTQDQEFLKEKALPYLLEAAKFFESLFELGSDGHYHAKSGTGYEGWILLRDAVSEIVYARVLFSSVIEALEIVGVDEPRTIEWKKIVNHLAAIHIRDGESEGYFDESGKLTIGSFKGDAAPSRKIISAGYEIEHERWVSSILPSPVQVHAPLPIRETIRLLEMDQMPLPDLEGDNRCNDGVFPWVEYCAVFPSGLIGLSDKNSENYKAAQNTAKLFSSNGMGWDVLPIALARLGLAEETWKIMEQFPASWQFYVNGWGHYGTSSRASVDGALRFRMNKIVTADENSSREFLYPGWPFRHMGMESMSVLATAINESLMQSHDGTIRIGPAIRANQSARFTLHAVGGYRVSSEIQDGKPSWVAVQCKLDGEFRLENPWKVAFFFKNGESTGKYEDAVISIKSQAGDEFWFCEQDISPKDIEVATLSYSANTEPKTTPCGMASLGLHRMF